MSSPQTRQAGRSRIEHYRCVDSTNALALARARSGRHCPEWFLADEQTAGRGRHGRPWHSPAGNLYATRLIVAPQPVARMTELAFVAAVALHDAIASVLAAGARHGLRLKWPNDLLVGGAKLAGILTEADTVAERVAVAVGMGINVRAAPPDGATSLAILGCDATASDLFEALDPAFEGWLATWDEGRGFAAVRVAWLERGPAIGTSSTVRSGIEIVSGHFAGLAENGALILDLDGGRKRRIAAGEVLAAGADD